MSDTNAGEGGNANSGQMICERCGNVGEPVKHTPGSTSIAVVLLAAGAITYMFLMPPIGIALLLAWGGYGVWRLIAKKFVCPSCKAGDSMLPIDSPKGIKLREEYLGGKK